MEGANKTGSVDKNHFPIIPARMSDEYDVVSHEYYLSIGISVVVHGDERSKSDGAQ